MAASPGLRQAFANMVSFISSGQNTDHDQLVALGQVQADVVDQVVLQQLQTDFGARAALLGAGGQVLLHVEERKHRLGVFLAFGHCVFVGQQEDRAGLAQLAALHGVVFAQLALDVEDAVLVPGEPTWGF